MMKERWADMDVDGPWPDPPEFEKKYAPPARCPRVSPRKPVVPPPELKENNPK